MSAEPRRANEMRIALQVGTILRIKNTGDVVVDNPELELAADEQAADAVLIYRLDPETGATSFASSNPWHFERSTLDGAALKPRVPAICTSSAAGRAALPCSSINFRFGR